MRFRSEGMASDKLHEKKKSSELALQELAGLSSSGLAPLLEVLPDALVCVDQQGIITQINGQAEVLFGYGRSELCGQPLETLLPERFRSTHNSHRERYQAAPHARSMGVGLLLYGRHKDGSEFPVDISLSPVQLDGKQEVIAAIRDITYKVRAERVRELQIRQIRLQSELINLAHDAIL